jgi:hypothetical protein
VDVFFGALYACVEVGHLHFVFSGFLDQACEMVGVGATGVHSERHDLNLHDDRVVANSTDLGSFQSARYFHTSGLSFVHLQESLNNVFLQQGLTPFLKLGLVNQLHDSLVVKYKKLVEGKV